MQLKPQVKFLFFSENPNVFTDKQEAFKLLKTHKEARLKEFKTNEEAVNFSKNGMAVLPVNTTMSSCMYIYCKQFIDLLRNKKKKLETGGLNVL